MSPPITPGIDCVVIDGCMHFRGDDRVRLLKNQALLARLWKEFHWGDPEYANLSAADWTRLAMCRSTQLPPNGEQYLPYLITTPNEGPFVALPDPGLIVEDRAAWGLDASPTSVVNPAEFEKAAAQSFAPSTADSDPRLEGWPRMRDFALTQAGFDEFMEAWAARCAQATGSAGVPRSAFNEHRDARLLASHQGWTIKPWDFNWQPLA